MASQQMLAEYLKGSANLWAGHIKLHLLKTAHQKPYNLWKIEIFINSLCPLKKRVSLCHVCCLPTYFQADTHRLYNFHVNKPLIPTIPITSNGHCPYLAPEWVRDCWVRVNILKVVSVKFKRNQNKSKKKTTLTIYFDIQSFVYLKASVQGKKKNQQTPVQLLSNGDLFSNKLLPLKWSNVPSDTEDPEG